MEQSDLVNDLLSKQVQSCLKLIQEEAYVFDIPKLFLIYGKDGEFKTTAQGIVTGRPDVPLRFDDQQARERIIRALGKSAKSARKYTGLICVFLWYGAFMVDNTVTDDQLQEVGGIENHPDREEIIFIQGNDIKRHRCSAVLFVEREGQKVKLNAKPPSIFPYNAETPTDEKNLLDLFWEEFLKGQGFGLR
ncbi:hypothetical protein IQ268_16835 [Oculatella sp. LEGE 06141]|uniref:hypothetical protein n=1 Tax=Oculatella sp. LEGE 06141 TaxID=1828648 RepID=UPI001883037E|nr:hypothetical protein [Oculatella sp. LEGE 06141]MBE9180231.1 hypothetical protein [Oculatella sp. LEGE 06141]